VPPKTVPSTRSEASQPQWTCQAGYKHVVDACWLTNVSWHTIAPHYSRLTCALLAQLPNDRLRSMKLRLELRHTHVLQELITSVPVAGKTAVTCAMTTEVMAAHLQAMAYWTTCAPGVAPPQDRMQP
jgi:hypothetical protein